MRTLAAFCCVLSALAASPTAAADIHVEGTEGAGVTFECKHKLASGLDKYFCRDPCRDGDVLATVAYGETRWAGRVTLVDLRNGTFSVNISRLRLSDSGTYWCAVHRHFFYTFTAVHLTVKTGASMVTPDVSFTWTHPESFSSTQKPEVDTSGPAPVSETSNYTKGGEGENSSMSSVLYAAIGAISTLALLVFAASFRKCREASKPQPREADRDVENMGKHVQSIKEPAERTPCAQRRRLDPPTSTSASTAADSVSCHVYENVGVLRSISKNSAGDDDIASRMYVQLLAHTASERGRDDSAGRQATQSCARAGPDSRSSDSSQSKPRALWFGLDASGII